LAEIWEAGVLGTPECRSDLGWAFRRDVRKLRFCGFADLAGGVVSVAARGGWRGRRRSGAGPDIVGFSQFRYRRNWKESWGRVSTTCFGVGVSMLTRRGV
jgi:hypothetical protein